MSTKVGADFQKPLVARGATSGRSDDNEVVIRNRLREYTQKTLPVLQFYRDRGIYVDDGDLETILRAIGEELRAEALPVVVG